MSGALLWTVPTVVRRKPVTNVASSHSLSSGSSSVAFLVPTSVFVQVLKLIAPLNFVVIDFVIFSPSPPPSLSAAGGDEGAAGGAGSGVTTAVGTACVDVDADASSGCIGGGSAATAAVARQTLKLVGNGKGSGTGSGISSIRWEPPAETETP